MRHTPDVDGARLAWARFALSIPALDAAFRDMIADAEERRPVIGDASADAFGSFLHTIWLEARAEIAAELRTRSN